MHLCMYVCRIENSPTCDTAPCIGRRTQLELQDPLPLHILQIGVFIMDPLIK
jgi:hypothetical protein